MWKWLGDVHWFIPYNCWLGLLVHLLNRLGYSGCGVDLRERKTWKGMFPQGLNCWENLRYKLMHWDELLECTIDPSSSKSGMPNGIDYLIGNHSDELTPWIPLLAARFHILFFIYSIQIFIFSLSIPFFLLPCCPFDFYGKLPRKGTASLYEVLYILLFNYPIYP